MSFLRRAALATVLGLAAVSPLPVAAGLVQDIVTATYSGLALRGYDPVAYFAGRAEEGRAEYSAMWHGVPWQFANAGNRDAFLAAPEVYAPAFGGHCPIALTRSELTEADPRLFAVHRGRVYLFFSPEARAEFLRSPDGYALEARLRWKEIAPHAPEELTPLGLPRR